MRFNKIIFILLIIQTFLWANKNTVVTGDVSYYYMQRLKDQSLVNIPFRMLNLNVIHQNNNFDVNGTFALEYRNRKDTDFMESSDPSDVNPVLRELYLTYFLDNGEISLGKKIYTWGSVDENSPIDILNAHDNYYLLIGTSERKLGSYSISFDYYLNNGTMKISGIYAPMHNATRYPINDDEYEFGLPTTINKNQIIEIEDPAEMGFSIQQSFNRGEITLSHYRAYDRVPSLSGFNMYQRIYLNEGDENNPDDDIWVTDGTDTDVPNVDTILNYDLTETTNIGSVFLFNDFTIRFDYALFKSQDEADMEDYLNRECSSIGLASLGGVCDYTFSFDSSTEKFIVSSDDVNSGIDQENFVYLGGEQLSFPIKEKAEYTQQTFQIELPLADDYQINMQYFKYEFKRKNYYYDDPLIDEYGNPSELDLTNVPLPDFCDPNDVLTCLLPYGEYNPGMGAPFAILSSETMFISLEKMLLDNDLKLTLSTLMDLDKGFGELASFEADYNMGNGLNALIGLTKVIGDDEVENYAFNDMEDFSNLRFELKYNF